MKEGWETKALNKVCKVRPQKRAVKKILDGHTLVSFVPMSHLEVNQKYFTAESDKPLDDVYQGYTYFADNDVLLAKITPCFENGKLGIALNLTNGVGFGSSEFVVYRSGSTILPEFLYYFLMTPDFRLTGKKLMGGAVGHQRIPKEFYEGYEIPIPPLPEQKRIVAILDEAFEAIDRARANIEKNIRNAEELFQCKLNEIFSQKGEGWEDSILKVITTKIGSGATPRGGKKSYKKSGISLIRSMNVYDEGFKKENLAFIDDKQAEKLRNVEVRKCDVLLNITGASVARCCIVPDEYLPARVNQHVSIIRIKSETVDERFLHYSLISKPNKEKLLGIGEQGSTRQAITKSQIQNFSISYPTDIEHQRSIVKTLDSYKKAIQALESVYQVKLSDLEEFKKSLLQKAFSGELTANEPMVA